MLREMEEPEPRWRGAPAALVEHGESTSPDYQTQARVIRRGGFEAWRSASGRLSDILSPNGKLICLDKRRLQELRLVIDELLG